MKHEQLSYQEALRYLAKKYRIEIVEREETDEQLLTSEIAKMRAHKILCYLGMVPITKNYYA